MDERMARILSEAGGSGEGGGPLVDWSLRVSALAEAFSESRFVVLRDPRMAILSSMSAWATGRFAVEPPLPGWWGEPWSFPVVEGWQGLVGRPLAQVAAAKWLGISAAIREDI